MAQSTNNQMGDGKDNYGQAAKQMGKAAKQVGKNATKNVAAKGAEATGKAAAATVKAGVQTGKAVSQIAAGTAAGGPWGAIISAAWSMRHTLYKILICICLVIAFLVAVIVSLPSIIFDHLMDDIFGSSYNPSFGTSINAVYYDLSGSIYNSIDKGYQFALSEVDRIISEGDYDYELSISMLDDQATSEKDYDVCYILAAYSASVKQAQSGREYMVQKLESTKEKMFPITYEERTIERPKEDEPSETETIKYVACIIHSFDEGVILKAFEIDLDAQYSNYNLTYGEYIDYMAYALSMTVFGYNRN